MKCPDCSETFKNSKELETHIKQFHFVTDYQCPHCKKYLRSERNYVCDFKGCGKAFKTKVDLSNHKKKQSDKKHVLIVKKSLQNTSRPSRFKKHPEEYKAENDPKVEE